MKPCQKKPVISLSISWVVTPSQDASHHQDDMLFFLGDHGILTKKNGSWMPQTSQHAGWRVKSYKVLRGKPPFQITTLFFPSSLIPPPQKLIEKWVPLNDPVSSWCLFLPYKKHVASFCRSWSSGGVNMKTTKKIHVWNEKLDFNLRNLQQDLLNGPLTLSI